MLNHVNLKKTGQRIKPVGESALRDAAAVRCTYAPAPLALPVDVPSKTVANQASVSDTAGASFHHFQVIDAGRVTLLSSPASCRVAQ